MHLYLKKKRIKANLSIADAALELGVPEEMINNWENGTKKPTIEDLKDISMAYRISKRQLTNEFRKSLSQENNDIFGDELMKKKHFLPKDFDLEHFDLTLTKSEVSILIAIRVANLCGSSYLSSLYKIIDDPINLNKALNKLLKYKLIEFDETKGFCCLSQFGMVVVEIIQENNLFKGFSSKRDLRDPIFLECDISGTCKEESYESEASTSDDYDADLADFLK